jgi:peptidoglycan hydrolase-like protein with peptidoglycan-binding domain
MINAETEAAIARLSAVHGMEAAGLMAFVETESAEVTSALVDGRNEPLIRYEGHYFFRLIGEGLPDKEREALREKAVAAKLASPSSGGVPNPASQQDRWDKLLRPAMAMDVDAALESCSYGIGQVMGANWKMLGFGSTQEFINTARAGIEGQIELMVRFIEKSGLKGALAAHDWTHLAAGYNGPSYRKNAYDVKLAEAYHRHTQGTAAPRAQDGTVLHIQQRLVAHGFDVAVDGVRGPNTVAAIIAFQKAKGLEPDGIVGRFTLAALGAPI